MSTKEMTPTIIDTLVLSKRLQKHGFTVEQAEGLAEEFAETTQYVRGDIATKNDLQAMKLELENQIEQAKRETLQWVAGFLLAQTGVIITLLKLL